MRLIAEQRFLYLLNYSLCYQIPFPASFSTDFDLISLLPECLSCINLIYIQGIKVILVNMHIETDLHLEFLFKGKTQVKIQQVPTWKSSRLPSTPTAVYLICLRLVAVVKQCPSEG